MHIDIIAMLSLPAESFRAGLLELVTQNDVNGLFDMLCALGNVPGGAHASDRVVWDMKEKQLKQAADVYIVVAPFVAKNYVRFSESRDVEGVLRQMCLNYLNACGCVCGKPFDDLYFEEDGVHLKCELYRKWGWAHLPADLRHNYGIFE